jgi:hypothetical protein
LSGSVGEFIVVTLFFAMVGGAVTLVASLLLSPSLGRAFVLTGVGAGVGVLAWVALWLTLFAFDQH